MRPIDPAEADFRLRTLRTGIWPSAFACLYTAVYALLTWGQPDRLALLTLVGVAIVATVAVAALPAQQVVGSRWAELFFITWSVSLIAIIAAAVSLDGGPGSPLTAMFFLPLAYAALSYPLASMVVVAVIDVAAYVLLGVLMGGVPFEHGFVVTAALVNAAVVCAWQARTHDRQRRALALASRSDALTGVLNRRGFEERFVTELARARREVRRWRS